MSAPISSAISTGSELRMPCPISERWQTIVTSPSGATCTKTFGFSPGAEACPAGPDGVRLPGVSSARLSLEKKPRARPPTERFSPARKVRRAINRCRLLIASSLFLGQPRGLLHGRADARVRATPAQVARQRLINLGVGGLRLLREQGRRGHDLSGLAEAALRNAQVHPGALQRVVAVR